MNINMGVTSKLSSPLSALVLLILGTAFAALTLASSISGALTNAAVRIGCVIGHLGHGCRGVLGNCVYSFYDQSCWLKRLAKVREGVPW